MKEYSQEYKDRCSKQKKEYYKLYPEKHPNSRIRNNPEKITYPEKLALLFFIQNNIQYIHQFSIGSYFVDFLVEDLVIEVDGEFWHKDAEKEKKRDEFIKSQGYRILHIPSKSILENLNSLFKTDTILSKIDVDAFKIIKVSRTKPKNKCILCNKEIGRKSTHCIKHHKQPIKPTKVAISKEELQELISKYPMTKIAEILKISDKTVKKYCKRYGLETLKRGDWNRLSDISIKEVQVSDKDQA